MAKSTGAKPNMAKGFYRQTPRNGKKTKKL